MGLLRAHADALDEGFHFTLHAAETAKATVATLQASLDDVQARHRAMVRTIAGVPMVGSPVRIDGERADSDLPPPALGEHTAEILKGLGVSDSEALELKQAGISG